MSNDLISKYNGILYDTVEHPHYPVQEHDQIESTQKAAEEIERQLFEQEKSKEKGPEKEGEKEKEKESQRHKEFLERWKKGDFNHYNSLGYHEDDYNKLMEECLKLLNSKALPVRSKLKRRKEIKENKSKWIIIIINNHHQLIMNLIGGICYCGRVFIKICNDRSFFSSFLLFFSDGLIDF